MINIDSLSNLAEMIFSSVENYPNKPIIYASLMGSRVTTYRDTYDEAKLILCNLYKLGVKTGNIVVLALDNAADFIPMFWACILGGIIPCPIIPRVASVETWKDSLDHLLRLFDHPAFITPSRNRELFDIDSIVLTLEDLRVPTTLSPAAGTIIMPDIAFLMLTSGSTGHPKAVALTHKNSLNSLKGKQLTQKHDDNDVTLNWVAFDHVASLLETHLFPLSTGSAQVHVPSIDIISDPLFFLEIIDRYRVSMTFTPNFLLGQIVSIIDRANGLPDKIQNLNLSCLRHIISGGEAVVCKTGERFLSLLEGLGMKRSVLWPAFGMTETCAGSIYSIKFESEADKSGFASLGVPVYGLEMRIVGEYGEIIDEGREGELQLRGPMIFKQYYSNENATKDVFCEDGWFKTGDLGVIESGSLRLVGRSKDSIIVNGTNYFLHELEAVIEHLEGVTPSFVAAFPTRLPGADTEDLIIFYSPQADYNTPKLLRNVNIAIRNITILHWGFRPFLVLPVPKDVLTKTSLGKIQRSLLRRKYEAGEFNSLIEEYVHQEKEYIPAIISAANEMEKSIISLFSNITGIAAKEIGATSNFFSLGGTSLEILRLLNLLKEQFGVRGELSLITLLQGPTPRKIADRISAAADDIKGYNPIVPLQEKGAGIPVFCIHPGVGEVLVFVNLANFFMDERPFFALRARGFNYSEMFFGSFDELVSNYVAAIRQYQPHGPYIIAGYSYGGPVSLPVAQRLEAEGEKVALVAVIDAPPVIEHPRGEVDRIESALMLSFFLGFIGKHQLDTLSDYLRQSNDLDPAEYLFSLAPPSRIHELGLDMAGFKHWSSLAYGLSQIGRRYKPEGKVENVVVFYASPLWGDKLSYLENQLKKWDKHSRSPVRYIEVPGEHHTILNPEFVGRFQEIFRSELSKALCE
jgi:acyl-CoA synthetase (AMP-forming)/AMP-acid ligase II/thioesterase domain-containing protein/acyl carrier protein